MIPLHRRQFTSLSLAICALGFATGCSSLFKPDLGHPADDIRGSIPEAWDIPNTSANAPTGWVDSLGSAQLTELIEEAIDHNFGLAAAAARVRQATARATGAGARQLPSFDFSANAGRSENLRGARFETVRSNNFNLGFDLAWEVDLSGRLANLSDAAAGRLDATHADYQAARLSLAANVADAVVTLTEAEGQIGIANANIASLQTNLAILDAELEAGVVDDRSALSLALSRADVARSEASLAASRRSADSARRRVEALLGRYPAGALDALGALPSPTGPVPAGIPSELLLRRPDLLAAEARAAAALDDHTADRKALLPSIRLNAGSGTSTTGELSDLIDLDSLVWNIGAGVAQPIFEGGALRANAQLSRAEYEEVASNYADSALTAFREVESALAAEPYLAAQERHLDTAAEESSRAADLALDHYEKGIVEILTVLESQQRAFTARSSLLAVRAARLRNRIALHLALGGDF